jgi:hypothetical protein
MCERAGPIVEDGFEEEMKYFGQAVLPIKSMDARGVVLYVGTFSKVVFPGLRVGWIAADRDASAGSPRSTGRPAVGRRSQAVGIASAGPTPFRLPAPPPRRQPPLMVAVARDWRHLPSDRAGPAGWRVQCVTVSGGGR